MNLFKTLNPKTSKFINLFSKFLYPVSNPNFSTQNPNFHNHIVDKKPVSKPTQIPYQSKISNWVNLIGTIKTPVKFVKGADGDYWAGTLVSQDQYSSNLPLLWMPVIFQGDLAHTAMMHLKENDEVHIEGQLSPEPLPINLTNNQTNVQVRVHNVHFVRGLNRRKKKSP